MSSMTKTLVLDEEMDRLITLCSYISQMASRIRFKHLSNVYFSPDYIKSYHHQLLSIAENVEGSVVLLESLLAIEQRNIVSIKSRYRYSREELLKLRQYVTPNLSIQTKNLLNQIIECEKKKSWRDIRTILV